MALAAQISIYTICLRLVVWRGVQEEVDDAIAELEGMRKVAEADEAATVQLRRRLVGLQGTLRKTRHAPMPAFCAFVTCAATAACVILFM